MKRANTFSRYIRVGVITLFSVMLLGVSSGNAQWRLRGPFNKVSLEAQVGGVVALSPRPANAGLMEYADVLNPGRHIKVGVRYMITDMIGLRPTYGFHYFKGSRNLSNPHESRYLEIHRVGIDGVINLAEFFPAGNFRNMRKFNALFHAGGNIAFGNSPVSNDVDRSLIGTIGVTPQYRLSRNLALFIDLSAHGTLQQDFGYDGI